MIQKSILTSTMYHTIPKRLCQTYCQRSCSSIVVPSSYKSRTQNFQTTVIANHHRQHYEGTIRRMFHSCTLLLDQITVKVPTMGDSITEGTIVAWNIEEGQAVKVDDVVALIETDKVTIDIKADKDGVITKHHGKVDETVAVGANLYDIDTEAVATSTSESATKVQDVSSSSSSNTNTSDSKTIDTPHHETTTHHHVRVPSIKFLGKEGWNKLRTNTEHSTTTTTTVPPSKPNATITLDGSSIGAMYGRLKFSEREIEALMLGGASEAPTMEY